MNNVLSGLERDLVVSYLCDDEVPFTIVPAQPAEQIFSFVTGNNGIRVLPEGIILFTDSFLLPLDLVNTQVEVRFYFKKLGLSFYSKISKMKTGVLAIAIPKEILRLPDTVSSKESPFSCKLFLGESFTGDCLECKQWENFPLFVPQIWRLLPVNPSSNLENLMKTMCGVEPVELPDLILDSMRRTGKALLISDGLLPNTDLFSFDCCITKKDLFINYEYEKLVSSLESGFYFVTGNLGKAYFIRQVVDPSHISELLPLLGAAFFLSEKEKTKSIQNRISPLNVLYVSSAEMLLALESGDFPLQNDIPYSVLLQIPMRTMRRSITLVCSVDSINTYNGRTCACCRLSAVKAEDQRFLYESLNGKRFI